jgi:hypothetical protein
MQKQINRQSRVVIAPEPGRTIMRSFFIFYGAVVAILIALFIGALFLPEPLRDELYWNQFNPNKFVLALAMRLVTPFLLIIFIGAFINLPIMTSYKQWKWRILEKNRRRAVENHLSGRETERFPLPEVYAPLPASLYVGVRRNWSATLIGGAIYALLIGYVLLTFVFDWQINMQYLVQQGEISGWTLLGGIGDALPYCLYIFPMIAPFILAPRQRLIATRDGLACHRGFSFSFISWREAQLFAVIAKQTNTLVYELSSSTSLIRWSSKPRGNYGDTFPAATIGTAPLGLVKAEHSTEEYQWQICQLTAIVAARTNLPLYDLR